MVFSLKALISVASISGLVGVSSLIPLNSAYAYSVNFNNGGFEDPINFNDSSGWEGAGDTSSLGTYSTVSPFDNNQGVISTACPGTSFPNGECQNNRNDDTTTTLGQFNNSGNDQISASIESVNNLQSILGLDNNSLSIPREIGGVRFDGTNGNPLITRTPKEGSAIYQDITITNDGSSINNFTLNFNWDFLTNDGADFLGDQDFAFVSITNDSGFEEIFILEDSTGNIPTVASDATDFANLTSPYAAYISDELALTPGNYRVGFGVVDVDGVDRSSALLVDNFVVQEVPFEFSPAFGLLLMGGFFGINYLRRLQQNGTFSKH